MQAAGAPPQHRNHQQPLVEYGGDLVPDDIVGVTDPWLAVVIRQVLPGRPDDHQESGRAGRLAIEHGPPLVARPDQVHVDDHAGTA